MKSRNSGFIMMEVLVALVLVTSVGISIVLWAESGLHSVARLQNEYARMRAIRMMQDWIRTSPAGLEASGEAIVGTLKVTWKRHILSENPQSGYPEGFGLYDALLFEYEYQVYQDKNDTQPWFHDSAIVVIARKIRSNKTPVF